MMDEAEAVQTLAAAFVYACATAGKLQLPRDKTTAEQVRRWGELHLPNGDGRPIINEALRTLFGDDAPQMYGDW